LPDAAAVRSVGAALVAAVRREPAAGDDALRALPAEHDPLLVDAARFHRISPAVHVALKRATGRTVPELAEDHSAQRRRHLLTLLELERLATVLDAAGVPWAAFKGPVLATLVYERPDLRFYNDLDVLVDPTGLRDVLQALDVHGVDYVDRNWRLIARDARGELTALLPHGTALDLHWSLINDARVRRQFRLGTRDLLSRRVHRKVGAREVPVLEPHDRVVHLAVHAALSGGYRLLWLADLDRALAFCDADTLLERTRQTGTTLVVAAVLERCNRVLGTPIPAFRSDRVWRELLQRVDATRSPVLSFSGPSGQTVVRATRGGTAASFAELAVQCGRYARARFSRSMSANPLFDDVDGGERERFLRSLERGVPST
jgi:hypothetical protein